MWIQEGIVRYFNPPAVISNQTYFTLIYVYDRATAHVTSEVPFTKGVFFSTKKCALYLKICNFVFVF